MTMIEFTSLAVHEKQRAIHREYVRSQRALTIAGFRTLIGNTIIALGDRVHGAAEARCEDVARQRTLPHLRLTP